MDWTNNPSYYGQVNDGNLVDSRQNTGTASLNFEWYQKWVDKNINSIEDIKTNTTYPGYNTITNDAHRAENANALADPYVVPGRLSFHNGWVQHVAHDPTKELSQSEGGGNGTSEYSGNGNMDQLTFKGLEMDGTDWSSHTYDFNAGKGYGWGRDTTITHVNPNGHQERDYMNAALYANVDFNEVVYNSSIDGKVHCKYLMVYLTGDDGNGNTWGGWYLGFDLEGYGTSNQYLKTDGFCNDWIIKVGDVGVGVYQQSRIMCEDLGGTITKNSSDIDYNDIVLDITYEQNSGGYVDVKPRCAGGTLPILICYNNEPLFEVHEFFLANDDQHRVYNANSSYRLSAADYKTMINTFGTKTTGDGNFKSFGEYEKPSFRLLFGGQSSGNRTLEKSFTGKFDVDLLQIKVYRHNLEDYVSNPGAISEADWIDTSLLEDGVPLKFLVPQKVK